MAWVRVKCRNSGSVSRRGNVARGRPPVGVALAFGARVRDVLGELAFVLAFDASLRVLAFDALLRAAMRGDAREPFGACLMCTGGAARMGWRVHERVFIPGRVGWPRLSCPCE
jgi:hypothetical protein